MWDMLSPVLVSTAVIAAALAAIANVIVALMNNGRLRSIDMDKRKNELINYRYTKLYALLEEIDKEQGFANYLEDSGRTFTETFAKRQRYVELYNLARPLIQSKIRNKLDAVADIENNQFTYIAEASLRKDLDAIGMGHQIEFQHHNR